jgi:Protein of unknown function (DUF3800)
MTVSAFIDESGKFKDHKIICIGCVAAFNQHVDEFAHEWGRLLALNGMKNFHATKALKHHVPLGVRNAALGLKDRTDALLPFIACIRKYLSVAIGLWIDVKVFNGLPPHFFQVFGHDPSYMAFVRTILQAVDFTPDRDGMVLVCDEDQETALAFYRLYRRVKQVMPSVKRKLQAISFCDDNAVFAVQAADLVASMVRLDALARRDRKKHEYRRLFRALTAQPEKYERIWYCGIARGDKKALLQTAKDTTEDLRRRKLIT